jgi:carbon monoxide dehydrogenase subunit G
VVGWRVGRDPDAPVVQRFMPATPLTFGGEEAFSATPERLFASLTDLDWLAKTIPDLVSAERVDERTLNCIVRPGFSFLRGTLRLTIGLADLHPPSEASMRLLATGIGIQIVVESKLQITPEGTGARLVWSATVAELKGLVATVSRSLISAAAEQVIRNAWRRVHETLV